MGLHPPLAAAQYVQLAHRARHRSLRKSHWLFLRALRTPSRGSLLQAHSKRLIIAEHRPVTDTDDAPGFPVPADPVRAGIGRSVIRSQGQCEIGINRDKLLMPFFFRQQLDHLRGSRMNAAHRLMRCAAGCRPFSRPGISKPLHCEGRAAEFLVHNCICYVQFNHLYDIMVCWIN